MKFIAPEFHLEVIEECASTNELLLERRDDPSFSGLAIMAKRQTAGFGRRGRSWWTGEGNLALSLGFRLGQESAAVTLLPFVGGLSLLDALRPYLSPEADLRLKWPNDVYLEGKKLSGLIAQARQSESGADVVLGIGLNLRQAPPELDAISLSELTEAPSPEEFARSFLLHFHSRLEALREFSIFRKEWESAAKLSSSRLTILGEEGEFVGVELLPTGELKVKAESGEVRVLSSETVSLSLKL